MQLTANMPSRRNHKSAKLPLLVFVPTSSRNLAHIRFVRQQQSRVKPTSPWNEEKSQKEEDDSPTGTLSGSLRNPSRANEWNRIIITHEGSPRNRNSKKSSSSAAKTIRTGLSVCSPSAPSEKRRKITTTTTRRDDGEGCFRKEGTAKKETRKGDGSDLVSSAD